MISAFVTFMGTLVNLVRCTAVQYENYKYVKEHSQIVQPDMKYLPIVGTPAHWHTTLNSTGTN